MFVRRPDSPRRRVWMLALITVVALVPLGVGLGVSQLAGTASAPTGPALPPTATVTSSQGSFRIRPDPTTWAHDADMSDPPAPGPGQALVRMKPGDTLAINFPDGATPSSSAARIDDAQFDVEGKQGTPVRVRVPGPPGTYSVVFSATWPKGQAYYDFRVQVS